MARETAAGMQAQTPGIARPILKRMIQMLGYTIVWAAVLFASAGRLDWGRGWTYLAVYLFCLTISAVLVLRTNPEVAAARAKLHADAKGFDKVFAKLYMLLLFVVPVVAGFDAVRFGWSSMAFQTVYPGVILNLLAAVPIAWAMTTNPFLETLVRIQVDRGHRAVTTGPYRWVRHPMYVGCIFENIATPLILGSWWTYAPVAAISVLFVWRTALEDRTLRQELPGYEEYAQRTRYRLLPGVW